jgi:dipeptide/tripeptide permease
MFERKNILIGGVLITLGLLGLFIEHQEHHPLTASNFVHLAIFLGLLALYGYLKSRKR